MRRVLLTAAILVVLIAAALSVAVWGILDGGRPQRDGRAPLNGLSAPVEVRWDRWGVPHVAAGSTADLAAAVGWLHANDRFTQMELGRRAVAGRLAEVLGGDLLEVDVGYRRLGARKAAETSWRDAGPETRLWLTAYARGVNAWLRERVDDLPPTLSVLKVEPEPWTPVDSLGFAYLMASDLSFWQGRPEELRYRWLVRFDEKRMRDLLGDRSSPLAPEIAALAAAAPPPPRSGPPDAGTAPGSNSWVIGPGHSRSGLPIVANDPHLALRLPGVWYQMHLRAPGYFAVGMTIPGAPGVVLGRGESVAWAATNVMLDDHDLFFEDYDPERRRVRRGEGWLPVTSRLETVPVRGGEPVELELFETDIGPMLPAEPELGLPARSVAWTALLPSSPLAAFFDLARATNVEEAKRAAGQQVAPAQNLLVADAAGAIGYAVLGRLPARRLGDGRLPAPAWSSEYGWDGLRPASDNLDVQNPPEGFIVTANNDLQPADHLPRIVGDFDLPSRADRISERLKASSRWDLEEQAAVQVDVESPYARRVVAALGGPFSGDAGHAVEILAAWDHRMDARGPSALFALFERRLLEEVFGDELDLDEVSGFVQRRWVLRCLEGDMLVAWFDDVGTARREGRHEIVARALAGAWGEAFRHWGPDPADFAWGRIHTLTLKHPLGRLPLIGGYFDVGPAPMPGSETTVAAFGGSWVEGRRPVRYGPSMRFVAEPGPGGKALAVLPAGQSGHPLDPHYRDQFDLYRRGELHPVAITEGEIAAAAVSTLILEPSAVGAAD